MRCLIFLALVTAAVAVSKVKENRADGYNDEPDACGSLLNNICNRTELKQECEAPGVDPVHLTVSNKRFHLNIFFKGSFFRAIEYCRYQGMQLATIESKEETDALQAYMTQLGFGNENVWISGSDLVQEGKFVWMSNGTPMVYRNFLPNQPDNAGRNEHCVEIRSQGKWNDLPCNTQLYFVCEY